MKLFAVVYIFGKVAAIVGPWPDGSMDVCLKGQVEMEANADRYFAVEPIREIGDGEKATRRDFRFSCEFRDSRPELGKF